jgi:hypothetical protein
VVVNQSHIKRGITVGAFGGFIASVAFIGIMLCLPLIASLPIGIFLHALGLSVIKPVESANYGSGNINGGVISCLVLYVSVILTVYPSLLTNALAKYPQTIPFTLQGLHTHAIITQSQNSYLSILLGYGLFAYLVYGFILGGIVVWTTSLQRFNMSKAAELEKYR